MNMKSKLLVLGLVLSAFGCSGTDAGRDPSMAATDAIARLDRQSRDTIGVGLGALSILATSDVGSFREKESLVASGRYAWIEELSAARLVEVRERNAREGVFVQVIPIGEGRELQAALREN